MSRPASRPRAGAKERAAANPTLTERAEHKEAGLQAVYANDMAADARRLGSGSTDKRFEDPLEYKQREEAVGTTAAPLAPNDNIDPRTGLPGNTPKPIPPPNESFGDLQKSVQAINAPSAPPMPGPSDSVPAASSRARPIANDNTMSGPN